MHSGTFSNELFNKRGEIRGIKALNIWLLKDVLIEKYHMGVAEAGEIAAFLLPMLQIDTRQRATAKECLEHPWLRSYQQQDLRAV
jgi:serine/threonine protein kinase